MAALGGFRASEGLDPAELVAKAASFADDAQRLVTFCASPPQIARLASACSVLVASLFVWCVRALIVGRERA